MQLRATAAAWMNERTWKAHVSFTAAVEQFLERELMQAATIRRYTLAANPHMEPIYALFKDTDDSKLPEHVLGKTSRCCALITCCA